MKDTSLTSHYQQILGETAPWAVSEVRLDVERLVNEAIELAKRYSTAESGKFVNGVLARLLKDTDKANWDPSALPEDAEEVVTASIEEEPVAVETIAPDTPEAEELDRVGKWMIRTPNSG